MACSSFAKLNSSSSQWIGQQSSSQRPARLSAPRRVSVPIRAAGGYADELVLTAVSSQSLPIPAHFKSLQFRSFLLRFTFSSMFFWSTIGLGLRVFFSSVDHDGYLVTCKFIMLALMHCPMTFLLCQNLFFLCAL